MSVPRFTFGPFELDPLRLELRRDGVKLRVGAKACRLLLALVERPGHIVSQKELLAAAWSGLNVEDVNLRVHIVALRKALSGVADGAFDITTVPREGYVFAGPVSAAPATEMLTSPLTRVPRQLSTLFGRREALANLGDALAAHRIVTIVGAGGMGKTALALAAIEEYAGTECVFVDFSTSVSSLHVQGCIFEALELEGTPNDVAAHIVRALANKPILLVFDNCEHVVGDVAAMVARLTSRTAGVSILATSREPLRVPGECVFTLEPLSCPPEGAELTAQSALSYAAIQMFVEAAGRRLSAFAIDDGDASLLGEVCRRLDGSPLAIELAAATSDTMTIRELARRLDDRFTVLVRGMRTALPKHRTLQAALDSSYDALSEEEALVMRRLGVFPGRFAADDAQAIAGTDTISGAAVHNTLANLVAKSLLTVDFSEESASFRFLETMRVYARLKLLDSEETSAVYVRFVEYTLRRLTAINGREVAAGDLKRNYSGVLDDWRAAHDWSVRNGEWHTALKLMGAGIGFCQSLNIKTEYVNRSTETIRAMPADAGDEDALRLEMLVCDHTAQMLVDTQPPDPSNFVERIETAALRTLDLSKRLNAPDQQMSALVTLTVAALTAANLEKLEVYGSDAFEFAQRSQNPDFLRTAHYLNGYTKFYSSDFATALGECDRSLVLAAPANLDTPIAFDHVPNVRILRSRTLWVRGEFQSSLEEMEEAHRSAIAGGHVPTIAWAAWSGLCVYLWAGAFERADASANLYEHLASEYSNPGWARYIPSAREAMERLRDGRRSFGAAPLDWTPHVPSHADFMTSIHCAFHRPVDLQRIEAVPRHWCAAEHFRAAGEHHLVAGRTIEAEKLFLHALATSQSQGNIAWEIRAILSLARLRIQQEQVSAARSVVEPLVDRFASSRVNADLVYAAELLAAC
ncbi:ATP-binding protein [Rhizobium sullae]|uniref:ATP-binding protein n=1 Tax=Rhizobium sullae TaxID=50338 RepID=UPI000B34D261|nr:winged helix-turn-helix domain-containing protein [Rhizobium sullae]